MNIDKHTIKLLLYGTFIGIGAILAALFVIFLILDISFINSGTCENGPSYVRCYYDHDWDSGTYLSTITSFYNTIITLLIAILGAFALISFFSIKASALRQVEDDISKEVTRYFESISSEQRLEEAIKSSSAMVEANAINRIDTIETILQENELMPYPVLEPNDEEET